jgi:hypothetical protein
MKVDALKRMLGVAGSGNGKELPIAELLPHLGHY